jgi:WD40 repeat protein
MILQTRPTIELIKDFTTTVGHISSVAISNDGNWIAVAGTGQLYQSTSFPTSIELYDRNWQQSIDKVKIGNKIGSCRTYGICFTSSNSHLVLLSNEKCVSCWDIARSSIVSKQYDSHGGFFYSFPHPDNETFFVVDCFNTVKQFSVNARSLNEEWSESYYDRSSGEFQKIAISGDRKFLYGTRHIISSKVMNNNYAKKIEISLPNSDPQVFSMDLSPDENILVTGSDQRIRISDARSAKIIHSFYAHADFVGGLVITADSRFIISAADFTIKIWDLAIGRKLSTILAHPTRRIKSTAFNRNTGTIVTGHDDGTVKVWQLS